MKYEPSCLQGRMFKIQGDKAEEGSDPVWDWAEALPGL